MFKIRNSSDVLVEPVAADSDNSLFHISHSTLPIYHLEIQQVVGNLFGGEPIEHGHDAAGEVEVGGATIRDKNAGVGTLITQSLGL